jgi:hypothetical protein
LKVVEMKRNQSRSGQAIVMAAFSLTLMLGAMSLVVDLGWGYYRREAAQSAADAAATAAIRAVETSAGSTPSCGTGIVWCGSPAGTVTNCPATAPTSATNSFNNACMLAAANGFTTTGNKVVSVQANTTSTPPTVPGATVSYWVTVRISENTSAFFSSSGGTWQASHAYAAGTKVVANGYEQQVTTAGTSGSSAPTFPTTAGQTTTDHTVTWTTIGPTGTAFSTNVISTAGITSTGSTTAAPCIYVLQPTGADTFDLANGATVTTSSCGVYVNSNNSTAMLVTGGARLNSPSMQVVGGASTNTNGGCVALSSSSACGSSTPTTGVAAVADPFSGLPAPTIPSSCASGNFTSWQATAYTPSAGCYNGFSLGNGMSAVMGAGTYVISGGSFSIQGGSTLTATSGVMIYLTGGAYVNIANGATVNMAPESSGTYEGVLFFQDRTVSSPTASTFAGGSNTTMTGSLYFPNSLVNINNGSSVNTEALVVGSVNFEGGAAFNEATNQSQTGLAVSTSTVSVLQ